MPPAPRAERISYGPNRRPTARAIGAPDELVIVDGSFQRGGTIRRNGAKTGDCPRVLMRERRHRPSVLRHGVRPRRADHATAIVGTARSPRRLPAWRQLFSGEPGFLATH